MFPTKKLWWILLGVCSFRGNHVFHLETRRVMVRHRSLNTGKVTKVLRIMNHFEIVSSKQINPKSHEISMPFPVFSVQCFRQPFVNENTFIIVNKFHDDPCQFIWKTAENNSSTNATRLQIFRLPSFNFSLSPWNALGTNDWLTKTFLPLRWR